MRPLINVGITLFLDKDVDSTGANIPKATLVQPRDHWTNKLLLGPPQLNAGLCLLNIVVYLYSNNLTHYIDDSSRTHSREYAQDLVLNWIVDRVPFKVLADLLQTRLPTLEELHIALIAFGVRTNRCLFVQKMLGLKLGLKLGLENALQSNELLRIAIKAGTTEMVKFLLDAGSDVTLRGDPRWVKSLGSDGFSVEIGGLLTGTGADLQASVLSDLPAAEAVDLIRDAVLKGNAELVQYWISVGLEVYSYDDLLMLAAQKGRLDLVNVLLQAGANRQFDDSVNADRSWDWTALHAAAYTGNIDIAQALLKAGSKINYTVVSDGEYTTCLQLAIGKGQEAMVRFLLESGADPNVRGNGSETPILLAMYFPDPGLRSRLLQILLEYKADPNIPSKQTHLTALDLARSRRFAESDVQLLLDAGAHINDSELTAPFLNIYYLAVAIRQGDIQRLEELAININMDMIDFTVMIGPMLYYFRWARGPEHYFLGQNGTILHLALAQAHPDCSVFKVLVEYISDINVQNSNKAMLPILHVAVTYCTTDIVKILLDAGADVNAILCRQEKSTTLLCAIWNRNAEMVRLLLDRGANINLRSKDDDTPLQAAIRFGQIDLAKHLLSRGADIAAPASEPNGATALQYMSHWGRPDLEDTQMLRTLLFEADVNQAPSENGVSAIQKAAQVGYLPFVVILLDEGAAIDFVSKMAANPNRAKTALAEAASQGHIKVAQLLMSRGANVNAPGSSCLQRPIDQAAFGGRLDMVQYLINAGADDDLPADKRYYAALRWAQMRKFLGVEALLRKLIESREEEWDQKQKLGMLPVHDERKCLSCNGKGCWKSLLNHWKNRVCPDCRGKGRVYYGEDEGDSRYVWDSKDESDETTDDGETDDEDTTDEGKTDDGETL